MTTHGRKRLGYTGSALKSLLCLVPRIRALFQQRDHLLVERADLVAQRDALILERDELLVDRCKQHGEQERRMNCGTALQGAVLELLAYFTPYRALGFDKVRVGRQTDGGYVMLDDFGEVVNALSFGVEAECSWDQAIAERGINVHMFDHTVDGPPSAHPRFSFHKKKITAIAGDGSETLDNILTTLGSPPDQAILKIDIEGSEWEVFESTPIDKLSGLSQIVCEFHNFSKMADPSWRAHATLVMAKLKTQFEVVHVHGNNHAMMSVVANVAFPDVVEVTFANRSLYSFEPTTETFPTPLDFPNYEVRPDIYLGTLQFTPPRVPVKTLLARLDIRALQHSDSSVR